LAGFADWPDSRDPADSLRRKLIASDPGEVGRRISSRDHQFLAVIGKQLEKNKSQRAAPASMKPYFTGV